MAWLRLVCVFSPQMGLVGEGHFIVCYFCMFCFSVSVCVFVTSYCSKNQPTCPPTGFLCMLPDQMISQNFCNLYLITITSENIKHDTDKNNVG